MSLRILAALAIILTLSSAFSTVAAARPEFEPRALLAAGGYHTCYGTQLVGVLCSGANDYGQATPLFSELRQVSAGRAHTCTVSVLDFVHCWGDDRFGQVSGALKLGKVLAVSAGGSHTCVLLPDGAVLCFGDTADGRSQGHFSGRAIAVSAGGAHTCVLVLNGTVDCYGRDDFGQARDYEQGGALAVSAGREHTCVLLWNGNVDCYGRNDAGQAEDFDGGDAIAVSAGWSHTCVLRLSGSVHCWGSNDWGQAADWDKEEAVAVSAGGFHTCVALRAGWFECWGANDRGQSAVTPLHGIVQVTPERVAVELPPAITTPAIDLPPPCLLDACHQRIVTPGHGAGTPAVEPIAVATPGASVQKTCVEVACLGPAAVHPQQLGATPGVGRQFVEVAPREFAAFCEVAPQHCVGGRYLEEQQVAEPFLGASVERTDTELIAEPRLGETREQPPIRRDIQTPFASVPVTVCERACALPVAPEVRAATTLVVEIHGAGATARQRVPIALP